MSSPALDDPRPLNVVFDEWWRRLQDPNVACAEFNRALLAGDLVASLYQEGKGPQRLARSYWRQAHLEFDRNGNVKVHPLQGDALQQGIFYISPAPHRDQRHASPAPPAGPAQPKHAGGRPPAFTPKQLGQLRNERARYEKANPGAFIKDVDGHLVRWAKDTLDVIASLDTIRTHSTTAKKKN
jgi:hypothetical protein